MMTSEPGKRVYNGTVETMLNDKVDTNSNGKWQRSTLTMVMATVIAMIMTMVMACGFQIGQWRRCSTIRCKQSMVMIIMVMVR